MTNIVYPKLNQTGVNEWADVEDDLLAVSTVVNGSLTNDNLSGAAAITRSNLAAAAKPLLWYTPTIIATEESRTSASYGLLATPDEVSEVVVPEGALVLVSYIALARQETAGNVNANIFFGSTAVTGPEALEEEGGGHASTNFRAVFTDGPLGLRFGGQTVNNVPSTGFLMGVSEFYVAPGTYSVSIRWKTSAGKALVKQRRLYVGVKGATA